YDVPTRNALLHFLLTMSLSTEQFQVAGPRHPIVAVLGEDAILPCFLVPAMNAENMELGWFRTTFSQTVFIYWNQWEQTEEQMAEYRGRTSLVRSCLTEGHAAMHLRQVRVSDNGMYTCFFRHGSFYEEADLEVKVAGMGSAPQVHIEGPEEDGVRVVCKASGWFPKPQVQWRDFSGNKFPALSEAHTQDSEQLFSVEATLVVRDSSVGDVTCSVLNPVLDQEKAVAIYIPEPFFPQASPWKPAFAVVLTMLGLLLLGGCYFVTKEHSTKIQVRQEKEDLPRLKEEEQQAKEEALKAIGSVTLDPDSAHYRLSVSHERMRLTWKYPWENLQPHLPTSILFPSEKCSVLGLEGITSGRWYWEVEINNEFFSKWTLGVCRKNSKISGLYMELPERGFWVMGKRDNCYFAGTDPVTWLSPWKDTYRVGVFLDYSEGDVSFYNMINGSHIPSLELSFHTLCLCMESPPTEVSTTSQKDLQLGTKLLTHEPLEYISVPNSNKL
uniref:Uncharacterized protein n=1 Tax=Spermophilus dauricus TaxID=99837 RepID=A0A8C9UIT3_SPEDA